MNSRVDNLRSMIKNEDMDGVLIFSPSNRYYISNFSGSKGYVIITDKRTIILVDSRYTEQAKLECTGYEVIQYSKFNDTLKEIVKELNLKTLGVEDDVLSYRQFMDLQKELPDIKLVSSKNLIEKMRQIKNDTEIENLTKAIEITDEAFSHILKYIKIGMTEIEVAMELDYFMKKSGANGVSFETIVAVGERSAMPHAHPSNRVINTGDVILMDYGALYNGYHADMTRTIFMGTPNEKLREIYNIVLEAQLKSIDKIAVGVQCKEVDNIGRGFICEKGYKENFGHGLGHAVGLDIHEKPGFVPDDETILSENMLITVEPGIYIEDLGGVRIEDIILVKNNGTQILTKSSKEFIIL